MSSQIHHRTCNLCEALCGLEIEVADNQVKTIKGDLKDPLSRGHICPKAVALKDVYNDPNRLKTPMRRTATGWESISWESAYSEIVGKLKAIQAQYGNNAVGVYQGNPSIHNLGTTLNSGNFVRLLKSKNLFSATSTDQLPHHFAAWQMFGHPMLLPVPDIDRTDFWLILGGNPIASNGSMMSAPDIAHRLKAIQQRGGQVIVVDPRRTETAEKATEHFFIRPNADVYLLLGLIHTVFAENGVKLGHNSAFTEGVDTLKAAVQDFSPEAVAEITGIAASEIRRLAQLFMAAKTAVCYGRVGVSTQGFGTLSQWLINALNILTGNCDAVGGVMFTAPAFEILRHRKDPNIFNRWQSRVRGLPEFMSELPVAAMAEEILTEGTGQIRALITSCGNPVLAAPNGQKMDTALEKLDFMVSIDIYINETTRHANIILPPATGLEVSHYDITFHVLAIRNSAKYSPPLFPKSENAKYDWEIFQELAHHFKGEKGDCKTTPPEAILDYGLKTGRYSIDLQQLRDAPHGIDLGALQPCFPARLFTADQKIQLTPLLLLQDLERARTFWQQSKQVSEYPYALIGRRHLRDNNSWLHNSERLVKGRNRCTLLIHPDDANVLKIDNQQIVKVSSRVGTVELPAEWCTDMMRGVVSMPHGYGHARANVQLDVARKHAGVSVNDLTDEQLLDDLTGNAAFSNVLVRIAAA